MYYQILYSILAQGGQYILYGVDFNPENRGDTFSRNDGISLPGYNMIL
jgi:hypothetical protein